MRVPFILCFELKRAEPLVVPSYDFGAHPSALLVCSASVFPLSKACKNSIKESTHQGAFYFNTSKLLSKIPLNFANANP